MRLPSVPNGWEWRVYDPYNKPNIAELHLKNTRTGEIVFCEFNSLVIKYWSQYRGMAKRAAKIARSLERQRFQGMFT